VASTDTQGGSLHEAFLPTATSSDSVFDANNKLVQINGTALTYDNNGSLSSDGTRSYVWDVRGRLAEIKQGAATVASFNYDALGRRVTKTVGASTTKYLYDGINAVQELTSSNAPVANIVAAGLDQWLWRTDAAGTRHFLPDALNSTRALSDDARAIGTRYQYEPFG
jgi:YD repeat-containing protein